MTTLIKELREAGTVLHDEAADRLEAIEAKLLTIRATIGAIRSDAQRVQQMVDLLLYPKGDVR